MTAIVSGWAPSSDDEIVDLHPSQLGPYEPIDQSRRPITSIFRRVASFRPTRPALPRSFTSASAPAEYYPSLSPSFSSSSLSPPQTRAPPPLTSSERRAVRNRLRDPNWIPRPRNAFIIFRCEYARQHARYAAGEPTRIAADKTLSKRAGEAWKKLPASQKAIFKKRADEEREEHARQHPTYRFNPTRPAGRQRSQSSPDPPRRTDRSSQVASLVAERERSAYTTDHDDASTPPAELVDTPEQSLILLTQRRSSSTPLPSSIVSVDGYSAPGLPSSYPNTPYLPTYQSVEGGPSPQTEVLDGYTFTSTSPVSPSTTSSVCVNGYTPVGYTPDAMTPEMSSGLPVPTYVNSYSMSSASTPATELSWSGVEYDTMSTYPQTSPSLTPEIPSYGGGLYNDASYTLGYAPELDGMSYSQQSLDVDASATYWDNGQATMQSYLAPYEDSSAGVIPEQVGHEEAVYSGWY